MNAKRSKRAPAEQSAVEARLAEPYAVALITWPAAVAAVHWETPEVFWWRVAACVWLAVFHLAAYRRGGGFGNVMLLLSAIAAWAWAMFPSPWVWCAFPLLLIGLHGAQRALFKRQAVFPSALPLGDERGSEAAEIGQ
jgi:hypothetical protein